MQYIKSKFADLLIYALGFISAVYLILDSCDSFGIDTGRFLPAVICFGVIIYAIMFRIKSF